MTEIENDVGSFSQTNSEYEVGFGKPPKGHRFKSGKSGNPRGRRKMSANIWNALYGALDDKIRTTKGRQSKKLSSAEVYVRLQTDRALRGDWKAFMWVMKLAAKAIKVKPMTDAEEQSGVLVMPWEFFGKSKAEQAVDIKKEAARRNDLKARGLPYP